MGRWSKERHAQEQAKRGKQASEAGKVLQERAQQVKAEKNDVPENKESKEAGTYQGEAIPDERGAVMAEINERNERTFQENSYHPDFLRGEENQPPKPEGEPATETQAEPQAEKSAEQTPEQPEQQAEPKVETVRVKVDGEEFDVPKAEVDAEGGVVAYQKGKAAENRLKKANEALVQTRQMQAQIAQWAQTQTQQTKAETPTVAQLLQDSIDTIRWGTPEESAAALQKVIELSNPRLDPKQITDYAVAKMQQILGIENFRKEFSEVVANPDTLKLATVFEQEWLADLAKKNQVPADWGHFYRAVGNRVRGITGRQSQSPASDTTDNSSGPDKEARKSSIVNLPTAAARATPPEAPKPESREDELNRMRAARGLPTG